MAIWNNLGTGGRLAAGAVAAIIVLLGGFTLWQARAPQTPPIAANIATPQPATPEALAPEAAVPEAIAPEAAAPEAAAPVTAATEPVPPATVSPKTTATAAPQMPAPEAPSATAPTPMVPVFDVVRIDKDGAALIAGQAQPGSTIAVHVDAVEAARADVGSSGKFAALFTLPASALPRVVTLVSILADGTEIASTASVILEPTPTPETGAVVAALADPVSTAAPDPAPDQTDTASLAQVPGASSDSAATPPDDAAGGPAVLMADEQGVQVLQPAGDALPQTIVIDTIAYDQSGDVILTGRGQPGQGLQVYLDTAPLVATQIAEGGTWSTVLPPVAAGLYTLRVDQLDETGKVTSRYETPFKREDPAALANLAAPPPAQPPAAPPPAAEQIAPADVAKAQAAAAPTAAAPTVPEPAPLAPAVPEPEPAITTALAEPAPAEPAPAAPAPAAPAPAKPAPAVPALAEPADAAAEPAPATEQAALAAPVPDPATTDPAAAPPSAAAPEPALAQTPALAPEPATTAPQASTVAATDPAPAAVSEGARVSIITVQPGFTLWQIANQAYGKGVMYVQVFEANRDKIKDPDLIYPGQVFNVPAPAN